MLEMGDFDKRVPHVIHIGANMKFIYILSTIPFLVFSIGVCSSANAQSVMKSGGWQMQMNVTAENPSTHETKKVNESTTKMCLSKEYLAKDPYLTPGIDKAKMERKNAKCSISDEKHSGNTASWTMACIAADGSTVDMSINNKADAHKLTSNINQVIKKGEVTAALVKIVVDMSFIGQCTNDMPKL